MESTAELNSSIVVLDELVTTASRQGGISSCG